MTLEITTVKSLRETVRRWRNGGETIALVPTMGALHIGHLALVKAAQLHANRVVVSIFVNPTQFGPNEDFSRYPRPLEADVKLLRDAGADAVWLPSVDEMYPNGFATSVHVSGPSEGLDGDFRPGHFDGVATVVAKLLLQVVPDVALFGEKDYQQLCVIRKLVVDLNIDTRIIGVSTVRESDGLALSSRNQYLSAEERAIVPKLYAVLTEIAQELTHTQTVIPAKAGISGQQKNTEHVALDPGLRRDDGLTVLLENAKSKLLTAGFASIDYLELRAEDTLAPMTSLTGPARLLVAAKLGTTRLIDNIKVE